MSHPFVRKDIIEFLVQRKFPSIVLATLPSQPQPKGTMALERMLRHAEMDRYRSELQNLPSDRFQSLYEIESAKALADMQREEEARFFNQSHAAADFDHWCKAEHWSLDEAIALSMGKAPEIVSWDKIKTYADVSPFVKQYARLRDLAERAKVWKKLFDPVLPVIFLKWAEDHEIAVPVELQEKVAKLKGKLADWKKNYDELRSMYDQRVADWKSLAQKQADLIETKKKRIADLEAELAAIKQAPPISDPTKAQSPIERQNMLKAIYAMAIKGYAYNPDDKRSSVISEIVSDISVAGFSVSDDTVRRYLKEARDNAEEWQEMSR